MIKRELYLAHYHVGLRVLKSAKKIENPEISTEKPGGFNNGMDVVGEV